MTAAVSKVEPLLMTTKQAAQALALSERTLWSLTDSGELPCIKMARAVRYSLDDLRAWIARNRTPAK